MALSVQQLASVFDNAPFGVLVLDKNGTITYINSQFGSSITPDSSSIMGRSIYDIASELLLDYNSLINRIKRLIDTGKPFYTFVETLSSKRIKGSDLVNINGYRQNDSFILLTTIESGSFKKETRYKKVIQVAPDSIIIMKKGVITFCNPAFADVLRMPYEEIVGKEIYDFVKGKDSENIAELRGNHIREFSAAIEILGKGVKSILGGKFHPIEDSPGTAMAILRDITEKVTLEKRLLRQNQDLSVINLISETLSSSLDLEKILQKTLDKVLDIMGIEAGWIYFLDEKKNVLKCAYYSGIPYDIAQLVDELQIGEGLAGNVAANGDPIIIENVSNDPRLTKFVVKEQGMRSFASIPLKSRSKLIGVMDLASYGKRDFSHEDKHLLTSIGHHIGMVADNALLFKEVANTSDKLRSALKIIKDRNRELRNLVSTVSHDLKSPLIAINGFARRLMKSAGPMLGEKELKYLEAINDSGKRMEDFVSNLLTFTSVGRHKISRESFDLKEVLDDVIRDVSPQLEEKNGKVLFEGDLPDIEADRTKVIQIFSNLISNAIKYSHPDRDLAVYIGYRTEGNMHIFHVKDNGIGISSEHEDSVFDLFFRTYKSMAEGDGLGLSIAKKAVSTMGGEIWLESKEGDGSTFFFSIPIDVGDKDTIS